MKKILFTLCVDNYAPEITKQTLPYLKHHAAKIGAEFKIITERKYPYMPPVYEKMQIFELGRGYDYILYFDADALIHPDMFDITEYIRQDTVMHYHLDLVGCRFAADEYFRRDGRQIGSGNWFTVAGGWCIDLWHPLMDLTLDEAKERIFPTVAELKRGITPEHLIDDFTLSRNIARFGLKFKTMLGLMDQLGRKDEHYFMHDYLLTKEQKLLEIRRHLELWGLEKKTELSRKSYTPAVEKNVQPKWNPTFNLTPV